VTTSPMALLHAAASYYQFPLIYGVSIYPRRQGLKRASQNGQVSLQSFGPNFIKTINEEWHESLANLFALWKCGKRDSFYSLSTSFTILFTRAKTGNKRIVITPTHSGFRQTLKEKGIKFSLPLKPDMMFVGDLDVDDCPVEFQPVEEDQTLDLDHDEWLRDIGISPRRTLRLSQASALDSSNGSKAASNLFGGTQQSDDEDSQDSSLTTILITGEEDIETFYKFFYESNVGSTRSGPHSGLPSTLIASAPFHRSILRHLQITSSAARRNGEMKYMLELGDGPILPGVSGALVRFYEQVTPRREDEKEEKLKVQVNGRTAYSGINEAIAGGEYTNLFEFEFDLVAREYSW